VLRSVQMPNKEKRQGKAAAEKAQAPGGAYKDGRCLTFTLTFGVSLDTIAGKVGACLHFA
jgi:hypothetical protein